MFFKLFELAPYLQALFPFAEEELSENSESFQKHALQVMETVDTAVTLILANDISTLEGALIDLGMVHNFKNVKPEHFAPVGQALLHGLSVTVGQEFTAEVKTAWVVLFGFVQSKMEEGMVEDI